MGQFSQKSLSTKGLNALFTKELENATKLDSDISPLISEIPTTTKNENFAWVGSNPSMRVWKDERVPQGLNDFTYTIADERYEATIQIDADEMADDQIGALKAKIRQFPEQGVKKRRSVFFDWLIAGTTNLAYDGQAFFSASHTSGSSGTQSNINSSGGGVTTALLGADLRSAITAMQRLKDDKGELINEGDMDLMILCPPDLQSAFNTLLTATLVNDGSNVQISNPFFGLAKKVVSSARLTDTNDWYLFNTRGYVKPFIRTVRTPLKFTALDRDQDYAFFMRNALLYGIDYRFGIGGGLWQKAYKVVNA